jgi:ABC-type transport system involved in multi-copper enzyme maturation permease subunit
MTRARRWLQFINPVSILFGPVFEKEVYVSGRKVSTYIVRGLACLALLIVMGIACSSLYFTIINPGYSINETAADPFGGAARLQKLQSTATTLAAVVGWFAYVLLLLVTPVFLAPSVMEEVRNRTLPALLTTPLTASEIILGKVMGKGVQILILALLPIPILLIARTFGGIPLDGILAFSSITLASVLQMAAISIAMSVISTRSASAIVLAYCFWIGINAAPPIALAYISKELLWFHISDTTLMALAAPVALGMTTAQKLIGQFAPGGQTLWIVATIYHLIIAIFLFGMSIALMRRAMTREGAGTSASSDASPTKKKKSQPVSEPLHSPSPADSAALASLSSSPLTTSPPTADHNLPESVSPPRTSDDLAPSDHAAPIRIVADDPVLWREIRIRMFRRAWHRWLALAAITFVSLWIMYGARDDGSVALPIVLGVLLSIALLQSAVLTTAGIANERESKTWETLLTTPLSGGEILWSKLAGAICKIAWTILAGLVFTLVFGIIFTQTANLYLLPAWLLVCIGPCFLLSCTGIFFSLIFTRATVAAVFNLGLALALWAALPLILAIVGQTIAFASGYTRSGDVPARIALLINPYAWFGISIDGTVNRWGRISTSSHTFDVLDFFNVPLILFFLLQVVHTAIFIAAGLFVMLLANRLFPRFSGRTPPESSLPIQATPIAGR